MDALSYFLFHLGLWDVLLITGGFLFGLLMGHWIWGKIAPQLVQAVERLNQADGTITNLQVDLESSRGENVALESELSLLRADSEVELKAARTAIEGLKVRLAEEQEKARELEETGAERAENLEAKSAGYAELEQQVEESAQFISDLESQLKVAEREKLEVAEQVQVEVEAKNRAIAEKEALQEVMERREEGEMERGERLGLLEGELASAREERDGLEEELGQLREGFAEKEGAWVDFGMSLEKAQKDVLALEGKVVRTIEAINNAKKKAAQRRSMSEGEEPPEVQKGEE